MSGIFHRLKYYLIGVTFGVVFVYFLFGDRDFQCSYFPNSRVLKDLNAKDIVYSATANCQIDCLQLDSLALKQIFVAGSINFSNSEPRKEPCGEYEIVTRLPDLREILARVKNCDSTVTVLSVLHEETTCDCQ